MLNYIAIELTNYLVRTQLVPPGSGVLTTNAFPPIAVFPALVANTRIDLGLIFALVAVLAVWFALYRTSWGLKLRLVGHNARFAEYAGIKAELHHGLGHDRLRARSAGCSARCSSRASSFGKLTVLFEGNLAFEGILVAIVARSRPLAVPVVALFYGYLRQGAQLMNIRTDVPSEVIGVVTAIIILLVASSFSIRPRAILARLTARRRSARQRRRGGAAMIELLHTVFRRPSSSRSSAPRRRCCWRRSAAWSPTCRARSTWRSKA